jgi:hypothetical protein
MTKTAKITIFPLTRIQCSDAEILYAFTLKVINPVLMLRLLRSNNPEKACAFEIDNSFNVFDNLTPKHVL